jgi:hypothetical protein
MNSFKVTAEKQKFWSITWMNNLTYEVLNEHREISYTKSFENVKFSDYFERHSQVKIGTAVFWNMTTLFWKIGADAPRLTQSKTTQFQTSAVKKHKEPNVLKILKFAPKFSLPKGKYMRRRRRKENSWRYRRLWGVHGAVERVPVCWSLNLKWAPMCTQLLLPYNSNFSGPTRKLRLRM